MFCGKCGAQNEDGATFCKECGAPLTADAPTPAQTPAGQGDQNVTVAGTKLPVNRNQLIGIGVIAAVVIVAIIIIANLLGGGGGKGTAEKFVKAIFKGDGKTVVNLMTPDELLEEICDRADIDKDEYIDKMNDGLEDVLDALDDEYDKWSVSAKATKTKDLSEKKIEELNDRYDSYFDLDLNIKEAQEVTLELTASVDGDKETEKVKLTVIKVDGKWYVDYFSYINMSVGSIF